MFITASKDLRRRHRLGDQPRSAAAETTSAAFSTSSRQSCTTFYVFDAAACHGWQRMGSSFTILHVKPTIHSSRSRANVVHTAGPFLLLRSLSARCIHLLRYIYIHTQIHTYIRAYVRTYVRTYMKSVGNLGNLLSFVVEKAMGKPPCPPNQRTICLTD